MARIREQEQLTSVGSSRLLPSTRPCVSVSATAFVVVVVVVLVAVVIVIVSSRVPREETPLKGSLESATWALTFDRDASTGDATYSREKISPRFGLYVRVTNRACKRVGLNWAVYMRDLLHACHVGETASIRAIRFPLFSARTADLLFPRLSLPFPRGFPVTADPSRAPGRRDPFVPSGLSRVLVDAFVAALQT